jgi:hypothetical protein
VRAPSAPDIARRFVLDEFDVVEVDLHLLVKAAA